MLATVLLLALVTVASVTDVLRHKIYNWTTYSGIVLALSMSAAGWLLLKTTAVAEEELRRTGWIPLGESLLGLAACGLLMLVCFVMFRISGGDVKLMAMLGAFLGLEQGLQVTLWTFVFGGCMGLIVLVWKVGAVRLVARLFRQLAWTLRLRWWSPLSEDERSLLQQPLFLAPSALAAVIVVRFSLIELMM